MGLELCTESSIAFNHQWTPWLFIRWGACVRKEVGLEICTETSESCIAFSGHLGCSSGGTRVQQWIPGSSLCQWHPQGNLL